ncbi:MAG: hypothetical protein ISQ08_10965 [Planctomycetes bacterium]|nr:hypothetical protein [Planctomycetota bacterium]
MTSRLLAAALALSTAMGLGSCVLTTATADQAPLAQPQVVVDFDSYGLRRVGVVPVIGHEYGEQTNDAIQDALRAEFAARGRFEVVVLDTEDLSRLEPMRAWSRGWYRPRTILELSRRHRLDGLLIGTVTDRQAHPPQRLGLTLDLVASQTGQTIWSSSVSLDASEERTRRSVEDWAERAVGDVTEASWETLLLSPRRFARFAARELARTLP